MVDHRLGDDIVRHHGPERCIAGAEALRKRHDVRPQAPMLAGEIAPGASRPAHHLVADEQEAELVANGTNGVVIAIRRHQRTGRGAPDRLHDEGEAGLRPLPQDFVPEHVGVTQAALFQCPPVAVEIAGGGGDFRHFPQHRRKGRTHERHAGDRQRPQRRAVIGGKTRNHLPALGLPARHRILPGELQRALHRFRTAGDEEHPVQPFRHAFRNAGGEPLGGFVFEMQPVAEGGKLHLPAHGIEHGGVGVTDIGNHRAA